MKKRSGYSDEWEGPLPVGQAQPGLVESDNDYPVAWLYLPDLSSPKGWVTHQINRQRPKSEKGMVGFRH